LQIRRKKLPVSVVADFRDLMDQDLGPAVRFSHGRLSLLNITLNKYGVQYQRVKILINSSLTI